MTRVFAIVGLIIILNSGIAEAFDMQQAINEINRALHAISKPPVIHDKEINP